MDTVWQILKQVEKNPGRLAQRATIVALVAFIYYSIVPLPGKSRLRTVIVKIMRKLTGSAMLQKIINQTISSEVKQAIAQLHINQPQIFQLPATPTSYSDIISKLEQRKSSDRKMTNFAYVYKLNEEHNKLTADAFSMYVHSNALNPVLTNSVRMMEVEIVSMTARLLSGGDAVCGSVTSCGTESLLLAVKTYRDYFYSTKGADSSPNLIIASTGHPSTHKGCSYFGVHVKVVGVGADKRMLAKEVEQQIDDNTCAVFVSAPQYPHGVNDPVEQIAALALKRKVPVHVDSAIGGFLLPFFEKLGRKVTPFDFRVPGVTSISADTHKFGYCPKGCSVLLFANQQLRKHQYFTYSGWPGGIYISPTCLGSRNGGPIAGAWASLMGLGQSGFLQATRQIIQTVDYIVDFVKQNDELQLVAEPQMSIIAISARSLNIYAVSDSLERQGFNVERQMEPACLHMTIMPQHRPLRERIVQALQQAVREVKQMSVEEQGNTNSAKMYGMIVEIPDGKMVESFLGQFVSQLYR